ncbi:hypothetical protein L0128_00265, partial [candidate division KSB1 bacterium]|nr:hypothetical protein [candidate division KSB1 bacterium]
AFTTVDYNQLVAHSQTILARLKNFRNAHKLMKAFAPKLIKDWEIEYQFEYFFPAHSFKDFTREILT